MGESRARELEAAARDLGLSELTLLDYRNGFLPWADRGELEADIRPRSPARSPDVVITFDEDGLYWHPDHIVLHERTTAVVAQMGLSRAGACSTCRCRRARCGLRWTAAAGDGRGQSAPADAAPRPRRREVDAFGLFTAPPTFTLDVSAFAVRKLRALRCHRSQMAGDALDRLPDEAAPRVLGAELYRRAPVGARRETFLDRMGRSMRTLMHEPLLDLLRCPFCGGRFNLHESARGVGRRWRLESGVIWCECCAFPIVAGIPVLRADETSRLGDAGARGRAPRGRAVLAAGSRRRAGRVLPRHAAARRAR